jgi:hypothetical protein
MIEEPEIDNTDFIARLAKNNKAKALMEATAPELQKKKPTPQAEEEYYDDYDVKDEPEYQYQRSEKVEQHYANESQYETEEVYEEQPTNKQRVEETYVDDDGLVKIRQDESRFVNDVTSNNEIYALEDKQLRERLERSGLPQAVIEATLKHKVNPIDPEFVKSIQGGATSNVIKERFGKKILNENKEIKKQNVTLVNEVKQVQQVNRPQTAQPKPGNQQTLGLDKEEIRQILREELSNMLQGKIILDIDEEVRIAVGDDVYKAKLEYAGKRRKK